MGGTEIAIASLVIAAVGTASSIQQGKTTAKFRQAASDRERLQAEENAELAMIEAAQLESDRMEDARRTKGRQFAQAAALGFDPLSSRSFVGGILASTDEVTRRDIANIRLSGLLGERRWLLAADAKVSAGFNPTGAILKGVSSAISTAQDANWIGKGSGFDTSSSVGPTNPPPISSAEGAF